MLCPNSLYRRKKPSETKFTKTDCCFFANKRYLCPRKEVAPPSKDTVVRATHAKSRCTIGGGRPIFGPEHKPVSARKLEWWNGRHEGLKILWPLRLCGFESRFEYREPRRIFCVALLFLRLQTFAARFFSLYHSLRYSAPSIYGVLFLCAVVSRNGIIGQAGYKKRRRRILRRR